MLCKVIFSAMSIILFMIFSKRFGPFLGKDAIDFLGFEGHYNVRMNQVRKKRYLDKLKYIKESLQYIRSFDQNELQNRGILYSIQVAIESTVDLVAMAVKGLNLIVADDKTNIEHLIKRMNWDSTYAMQLIKPNGLRI